MPELIDLPDGYYQVPPGRLVNAVTWLEMRERPNVPLAPPLRLEPTREADRGAIGDLFHRIGTPWLWSRAFDDTEVDPANVFVASDDTDQRVGIVELSRRDAKDVEIIYFGLVPTAVGQGLGRRMMAAALDLAWRGASDRVWLHTCNFDHPAALRFYQSCGFVPYATGFEIMQDPRMTGELPPSAAPHVPRIVAKDPSRI